MIQRSVKLDKAIFVISLDTELGWGSFDRGGLEKYEHYYAQTRAAIQRLLEMFERHGIKGAWAVVGHLFLRSCSKDGPDNHDHVSQPEYGWYPQGWLSHDPFTDVDRDPFFYAPDVVDRIRASSVAHELASHTFTHAILGDPECSREVALSQLAECVRLGRERGREVVSLVFPRNSVGHLDVLLQLGYRSFRGPEPNRYAALEITPGMAKFWRFFDKLMAFTPPCHKELTCFMADGCGAPLFDIPASMFYPPFGGLWNLAPLSRRVAQARKGIERAIREKSLFHMWFHPFNLTSSPALFDGLEEIFGEVARQVAAGRLESLTMAETAAYAESLMERGNG